MHRTGFRRVHGGDGLLGAEHRGQHPMRLRRPEPQPRIVLQPIGAVSTAEGSAAFFSASASDPEGQPLTYDWTFGDGSPHGSGATPQHAYAANDSGIAVDRVRLATFALGSGMAGLAGVLVAPAFAIDPQLGSRFIIKAFAVIIVGGMGSYPGAILAALLLGVVEVVGSYFAGAVIGSAFLFLLMLGVLLVRPRGLLGAGVRI